jgi:ribosomal protein S27E
LALWYSSCWYVVKLRVMCPVCGLLLSSPQTGHITLSSTQYQQHENQSAKYHRQQPSV